MNYSIFQTIKECGLPIVVTSSSPHLCFLVDTGSTHNVIFSFVLDSIKEIASFVDSMNTIMGIEGNPTDVPQIKLNLDFQDNHSQSIFSVIDATSAVSKIQSESGIQIHGIVGIPFLTQNKWILDFKQLTISN